MPNKIIRFHLLTTCMIGIDIQIKLAKPTLPETHTTWNNKVGLSHAIFKTGFLQGNPSEKWRRAFECVPCALCRGLKYSMEAN